MKAGDYNPHTLPGIDNPQRGFKGLFEQRLRQDFMRLVHGEDSALLHERNPRGAKKSEIGEMGGHQDAEAACGQFPRRGARPASGWRNRDWQWAHRGPAPAPAAPARGRSTPVGAGRRSTPYRVRQPAARCSAVPELAPQWRCQTGLAKKRAWCEPSGPSIPHRARERRKEACAPGEHNPGFWRGAGEASDGYPRRRRRLVRWWDTISPRMVLKSVVFPEPLGPSRQSVSPAPTLEIDVEDDGLAVISGSNALHGEIHARPIRV